MIGGGWRGARRKNDLHIVFPRCRCPIIVTQMNFQLSSIFPSTQFDSAVPASLSLLLSPFLCLSLHPPCFHPCLLCPFLCSRLRWHTRFRGRSLGETFNREWNSRWNVNETQLAYRCTLFPPLFATAGRNSWLFSARQNSATPDPPAVSLLHLSKNRG